MRKIIFNYIILQLLYLNRRVESLKGTNIIEASNDEFSYVASLQLYPAGIKLCTGVLITRKYVMTVGHCVTNRKPKEIQVTFELTSSPETATAYKVASYLTYDKWVAKNRKKKDAGTHDIAVLQLKDKINQVNINPINLSQLPNGELEGKKAVITGWNNGQLQKATVNILNNKELESSVSSLINRILEIDSRFLCSAAVPEVLTEKGDGGAPLVGDNNTLIGVNIGIINGLKRVNNSEDSGQQYQMNIHASVSYYWYFIVSSTDYH